MRIGVAVPNSGGTLHRHDPTDLAQRAEQAGFDSLWVADHVVMPGEIQSRYPFARNGRPTWTVDTPWYDSIVVLGMLAASTSTVELGTAALVLPLRHPVATAKQIATIDALNGGRTVIGVGAGWLAEEFHALEVPYETRGSRLDEWVCLLRSCWTGRPEPHDGQHYQLPADVRCLPTPARQPPILIAGISKAALRRVARLGDGWLPIQRAADLDLDELSGTIRLLHDLHTEAGRPFDELRIVLRIIQSAALADNIARALPDLGQIGITDIVVEIDWDQDGEPQRIHDLLRDAVISH